LLLFLQKKKTLPALKTLDSSISLRYRKFMRIAILLTVLVLSATTIGAVRWRALHAPSAQTLAEQALLDGDLETARIQLRQVITTDPRNANAALRLGQVQLALGDAVAAEHSARLAAARGAAPPIVDLLLAQSFLAQNRPRDLLDSFPPGGTPLQAAALLVLRSAALDTLDDHAAALAAAEQAEQLAPTLVDAPIAIARLALIAHDFDTAMRATARALRLDPRAVQALLLKGQIYAATGEAPPALEALDAALAWQPGLVAARLERARLRLRGGDTRRAGEDIDAALTAQPHNPTARYLSAVLLARQARYADAETTLTQLGDGVAQFPRGLYLLALVKLQRGQAEQAWQALGRHLQRHPGEPDALALYARLTELVANPGDPATLHALAALDIAARRYPEAGARLSQVLAQHPQDAAALNDLAWVYQQRHDPRALDTARHAFALAPTSQAADTLGWILVGLGRPQDAIGLLRAAVTLRPQAPLLRLHLATALQAAGQHGEALAAVQAALRTPSFDERPDAERLLHSLEGAG
jgi:tetratricopeptide (TPR) repeat protein